MAPPRFIKSIVGRVRALTGERTLAIYAAKNDMSIAVASRFIIDRENARIAVERNVYYTAKKSKDTFIRRVDRSLKKFRDTRNPTEIPVDVSKLGIKEYINRILNNSGTDKILLVTVNGEGVDRNETFYALNDHTKVRLAELITEQGIVDAGNNNVSDQEFIATLRNLESVRIEHVPEAHRRNRHAGAFFKYTNKTQINLEPYGIWKEFITENYHDTCLIYALKQGGLSESKLLQARQSVSSRDIPISSLKQLCETLDIQIILKRVEERHKADNTFGTSSEVFNIGLIDKHYFIIQPTKYTSFSIKNYQTVYGMKNWSDYIKFRPARGTYMTSTQRYIDSYELVTLVYEQKNTMLEEITIENSTVASTAFYNKCDGAITCLDYSERDVELVNPPPPPPAEESSTTLPKSKEEKFTRAFFDFETYVDDTGKHIPYLCCLLREDNQILTFFGPECGLEMLKSLSKNTILIAHNCSYDARFIVKYLNKLDIISKGERMYSYTGKFFNLSIKLKDSYHLISSPLKAFAGMFNLETCKEIMPYDIYKKQTITQGYAYVSDALQYIPKNEWTQFCDNLERWNLYMDEEKTMYNLIEYSRKYCEIDCQVLKDGYVTFREWMLECTELDIDKVLTLPSLGHKYLIKMGCYDGVYKLSGTPQRFIQKCVVGGRVMCANNQKQTHSGRIQDFDAVSLYPSAMARMDGWLKGVPKIIDNWVQTKMTADGYFAEVIITKVGKHRDFPLLSKTLPSGVRCFTNDLVGATVFIDKITLEDAERFQDMEFEFVRGYYFDEGFNSQIRETMTHLFTERKQKKKEKNPIQNAYKLLMNASYGKSLIKPVNTEHRIFDDKAEFDVYLSRNYNWVRSFVKIDGSDKIRLESIAPINRHFNIPHVGSSVLSWSKRIMNEVMCLAEDLGHRIMYQDTDSMHIFEDAIPQISEAFQEKYGHPLIGSDMGQFHSDFDFSGCSDIRAVKSIFLGKKCYIDQLEGTDSNGVVQTDYHIRMKGVPRSAIDFAVEQNGYANPLELYQDLSIGVPVNFDLTCGGARCNFKYGKDMSIHTLSQFSRTLKF